MSCTYLLLGINYQKVRGVLVYVSRDALGIIVLVLNLGVGWSGRFGDLSEVGPILRDLDVPCE